MLSAFHCQHVEVACLLSTLFRKFSITIFLEALDDFLHCEQRHILCTELCFHNDLRLLLQSSLFDNSLGSLSYAIILFVLGLPELYINLPLSKLFVDSAQELWHILFFSAVNCTSHRRGSQAPLPMRTSQCKIVESLSQSTEVR